MISRRHFSTALLSALLALPAAANAAAKYTVTIVGAAGSQATGINGSGAVIGNFPYAAGVTHGFVNVAGVITDLGTLGGADSYATGINDGGEVVGHALNAAGVQRAFLYAAGVMSDLGTLGGPASRAAAINKRGDIVGTAQIGDGFWDNRAFLLKRGARMQDLGRFEVPNQEGASSAMGLNEARQVVGTSDLAFNAPESPMHAFHYSCEEMTDLGTFGGAVSTGYAINAKGQVVGDASIGHQQNRAFIWYKGVLKNLGDGPDGKASGARGINDHGQVVGYEAQEWGPDTWVRAFIYQAGNMRILNKLIPPASGWSIEFAVGINNSGQIAATGCKSGTCYALRLDPVR